MVDLHTHSHFSDGSHSPAWLISQAREKNLAIANRSLAIIDELKNNGI